VDPDAKQAQLARNLAQIGRFGQIRWVAECGSTNTVLVEEARNLTNASDLSAGVVLVTDRQTAGKGRLGRQWEAPVGASLAMSIRVPVSGELASRVLGLLPLSVGLAALRALLQLGADPARAELKWPNDVMCPETGKKFAGILCEATGTHVIIGVGVNLTRPVELDPHDVVTQRAQWVSDVTSDQAPIGQVEAASALAIEIDRSLSIVFRSPDAALSDIRQRCSTIGRTVRIEQVNGTWEGTAVDLDDMGALCVKRSGSHHIEVVHAGDVVHLRSSP
jgi:BirA family transcriptional regulator, biotin operon repressor / biotin---[acetyl-CoA-carboxylase] ligase